MVWGKCTVKALAAFFRKAPTSGTRVSTMGRYVPVPGSA